jgi:hypothetical protein
MRRLLPLLPLLLLTACGLSPPAYVRAEHPPDVQHAPRRNRDGHVFYWVNERWYVQHEGQWYEYPPAPPPLNDWKWRR